MRGRAVRPPSDPSHATGMRGMAEGRTVCGQVVVPTSPRAGTVPSSCSAGTRGRSARLPHWNRGFLSPEQSLPAPACHHAPYPVVAGLTEETPHMEVLVRGGGVERRIVREHSPLVNNVSDTLFISFIHS
eukprot:scaffold18_cov401-Prasinococcus_capsulatus_cf.AAC.12